MNCSCGSSFEPVRRFRHYLICGDARDREIFGRIGASGAIALTFTSPPYGNQREYEGLAAFDWAAVVPAAIANCKANSSEEHEILVNLGLVHEKGAVCF